MFAQALRPSASAAANTLPGVERTIAPRTYAFHRRLWGICAVLAAIGLFTPNGLATSGAIALVPALVDLLWRKGEPPVLLFGCMLQWVQATAAIFYTNYYGMTLEQGFGNNEIARATWLSIAAVLVLALGIRCGFFGAGASKTRELESEASEMDVTRIGLLYGVTFVVANGLNFLAWRLPSITQPLLAIASLKWAVVFLLCYAVLRQSCGYGVLLGCLCLEFLSGLLGIFSNFKSVFLVLVVAAMSSPLALRGRRLATTWICVVVLFITGVVWTTIKMDYRAFLAEESSGASATPMERKFDKLADLVDSVTWQNFADGIETMIMRLSYVNYFALAMQNVPAQIPYENGALWRGSVVHVFTPRLLFPDKPALDDSERTRLYTGVQVAGGEQGSSIGIGYVGESYIDYGPIWMFAPIFLLGVLYGLINRFLITRTRYKLLGSAVAVSILIFNAYAIETSNIKLVGGVITATLAGVAIYGVLGGTIIAYLRRTPSSDRRPIIGH